MVSRKSKSSCSNDSLPASIFEKSRMSLRMVSNDSALKLTVRANSTCSGANVVSSRRLVIPMIAFIGVRISWLILARNSDLSRVDSKAGVARFSEVNFRPFALSDVFYSPHVADKVSLFRVDRFGPRMNPAQLAGWRHDAVFRFKISPSLSCKLPLPQDALAVCRMERLLPPITKALFQGQPRDFGPTLVRIDLHIPKLAVR